MLTGSITLDHCWLCGQSSSLEDHHVIPQSMGGQNGPTVTLCAVCHSAVHDLALSNAKSNLDASGFGPWRTDESISNAMYLANVIREAARKVRGTENKKYRLVVEVDSDTRKRVEELKATYGVTRIDRAVIAAIHEAHNRHHQQ